jgi:Outer membrane protein beta-barrel domain
LKMKKFILSLGCLCFLAIGSSPVMADDASSPQNMVPSSQLGVEAGFNIASLNGPAGNVYGSRLGFVGGAFLNFHLLQSLAIQPEVLYEQKGGSFNGSAYQLDYVEIPVLADIDIVGPLSILAGPAFDSVVATNGASNINTEDVGLVLGAQLDISNFLLSGRYEVGLTNLNSNSNIQNGTFTFMAGLSLI